jgi:hypothetical protein
MAEPGIYRDTYLDDPADFPESLPAGVERSKSYYAHEVVYEDGSRVVTWYRRGSANQPEQQIGVQRDTVPKLKEAWDTKVAKQVPTATSQETAKRQTEKIGGRVMQWNPVTDKYDIDLGPADAPSATANAKGRKATIENGEYVEREIEADGSQGRIVVQRPATKAEIDAISGPRDVSGTTREPVQGRPGYTKVTSAKKDAQGNETKDIYYEDAQGNRIASLGDERKPVGAPYKNAQGQWVQRYDDETVAPLPEGAVPQEKPEPYVMVESKPYIRQPDGSLKPAPIEGEVKPGQGPSLEELESQFMQEVEGLQSFAAKLQQAVAAGTMTPEEKKERWAEAKDVANAKIKRWNDLVTAQRGVYGDVAANWRQEQATANTRLNASTQALQLGTQTANSLTGASGSGKAGALFGTLTAGRAAGEMYGGYASGPPPALPPAAASVLGMEINADGSITMRPKGQGAGGAAQMPAAMASSAQSAEEAMQADIAAAGGRGTTLPGQPGPDVPTPAGMSFSGGQLRAPGASPMAGMPPAAALTAIPPDIRSEFDDDVLLEAMGLAV